MLEGWFLWFILFWVIILLGSFAIGGFFMFRKFLKKMPKVDGMSDMDWEEYYVNHTIDLWTQNEKELLADLVDPVPDVAKHKIAGKIGELALKENVVMIDQDLVIRGYIMATPKRDHKFLRKKLTDKQIELTPYEHLF